MSTDPLRLSALAALAIADIPPDSPTWQRDMGRVIARSQLAAWMAGTAERLGVPLDSALLSERRLSRAEREEIRGYVDRQLEYLQGFDREGMSDAAIAARMQLYASAARPTYLATRWGEWDIAPELWPGAQACGGNCRCTAVIDDHGDGTGTLTRTLGGNRHCEECPPLEGAHAIERRAA